MAISSLDTLSLDTFLDEHIDITDAYIMRGLHVDKFQNKIGEIITQVNLNLTDVATIEAYDPATISPIQSAVTILTATEIVGNGSGDIGHADGAVLVASQGAGYVLEFISATLIYDYASGDYTNGGNDMVINVGVNGAQVAITTAIAKADLLFASGDKVVQLNALTVSDQALTVAGANIISLFAGTPFAAGGSGVLRCNVQYRVHTTGL